MASSAKSQANDQEMTLVQHLLELRNRLARGIGAIAVLFLVFFPFANEIYTYLALPLTSHLAADTSMIATAVASPFLTPFKLALLLSIFVAMPYLLYQIWAFIAPGLYSHEKKLAFPLLVSSTFLFYLGGIFAYYVVFPLVFGFLTSTAPDGVKIATDISLYLDFVIKMFFAFGIAFEVPIATILLCLVGFTTPDKLAAKRPYIVVGAFVIGMLLTPPDVISQTLLAIPMWLLFELGVVVSRILLKGRQQDTDEEEDHSIHPTSGHNSTTATAAATAAAATPAAAATLDLGQSFYDPNDFDDRYADQRHTPAPQDDDLDTDAAWKALTDSEMDDEFARIEAEFDALEAASKKSEEESTINAANDDKPSQDLPTQEPIKG